MANSNWTLSNPIDHSLNSTWPDEVRNLKDLLKSRLITQATEPSARTDGVNFVTADLGSIWINSANNVIRILTAVDGAGSNTWTLISTEIITVMVVAAHTWASNQTLGTGASLIGSSTSDINFNSNKFSVAGVTGNTNVGGTLDVVGNIDPTTFETTRGGFLDEDNMASNAANKVASQQSIKAYAEAALITQATSNIFGTRTTTDTVAGALAVTSIYRVQCDGFLYGYGAGENATIIVYVEAGDATPDVAVAKVRSYASGNADGHFCVPVNKDDYWQVTVSGGAMTLFWTPIGTGGCVKQ